MVTASLAESSDSLQSGSWLRSSAGWLPRTGIRSETLCLFRVWNYLLTFTTCKSSKRELLGTAEEGILQAGFLSCHLTISVTEGKFWWKNKALFFVLFSNLLARVDNGISRRGWYQSRDLSSQVPPLATSIGSSTGPRNNIP